MNTKSLKLICALIVGAGMAGMAQPNEPDQRPDRAPRQASEHASAPEQSDRPGRKALEIRIDPKALRARLTRSILHAEQILERSKAALTKLDDGASPTEVLAEMTPSNLTRTGQGEHPKDEQSRRRNGNGPRFGSGKIAAPSEGPARGQSARQGNTEPDSHQELDLFLRTNFPALFEKLQQVAKQDKRSADRLLGRMGPQIRELMMLIETQPDLAKIKIEEMHAGLAFVEASRVLRQSMNDTGVSDSDRANAMLLLNNLAAQRFDIQIKAKQFEIRKLEARLDELKATVVKIEQRREHEIQRMVNSASRKTRATENQEKSGND